VEQYRVPGTTRYRYSGGRCTYHRCPCTGSTCTEGTIVVQVRYPRYTHCSGQKLQVKKYILNVLPCTYVCVGKHILHAHRIAYVCVLQARLQAAQYPVSRVLAIAMQYLARFCWLETTSNSSILRLTSTGLSTTLSNSDGCISQTQTKNIWHRK
jgi:hypothetical protein